MEVRLDTRCYSCEAPIFFAEDKDVCRCSACGRFNSRPKSEKQESDLMKYANERRNLGEFDKAEKAYDEVLKKNLSEHEARWGILLCRRGAIYLEDEATNTVVITCRKKVNSSIVTDPDFKRACEDAPIQVRRQYERDAEYIDAIQREIRSMTDADGCDIFICYKETEPNTGERTEDSVRALNLYQTLTRRGYRVFYAPVSLKNHLGANYEAAIFNAIETAQVMLALGTKANYFSTTWMQSEWRRFLEKVDAGERKLLVPLYQNFSPGELPTEFADRFLQGLDMSDVGFVFDLENMLNKVVRKGNEPDELTKLRAEIERMKQLEEERLRNAAEEAQRKAEEERRRAEEEAQRKAEEERKRAEEEVQRKAEEERQRREEAERKAEEERKQREEAERRAEEEAQRKAEEERKQREEAERRRAEEERKRREEAERNRVEEEKRKRAEKEERKLREEVVRKLQGLIERKQREEAQRKRAEEEAHKQREEAQHDAKTLFKFLVEGDERARAEAQRIAEKLFEQRAEEERKQREEAERKRAEDEKTYQQVEKYLRKQLEEAERKRAEEERKQREEAERRAKEETQRKAEEERKQREEAERRAEEEAQRKAEEERKRREEAERQRAEEERKRSEAEKKRVHVDENGEITDSWQEIFEAIDDGTYKEKYAIGNTKLVNFGKEGQIHMQIVAFDTDVVSGTGKKAPITWISKELLKNKYRMNPSIKERGFFNTIYVEGTGAIGGWEKCELRKKLGEIYNDLPYWLRDHILLVSKEQIAYTEERGMFLRGVKVSQKSDDRLWIPSDDEIFGENRYLFFGNGEKCKKTLVGSSHASWWWLRSASHPNFFYNVGNGGISSSSQGGVALGFCT